MPYGRNIIVSQKGPPRQRVIPPVVVGPFQEFVAATDASIANLTSRIDATEVVVSAAEARITALETPKPPVP